MIQRGKPDPAIYVPTLALLGTARRRTLAVGDSLRTDMAGAKAAGIDACWVLSGIHALRPEEAPQEAEMAGIKPRAILPGFPGRKARKQPLFGKSGAKTSWKLGQWR